jgi:RNA polymerase sigma-70 factor (ECF subfamily)
MQIARAACIVRGFPRPRHMKLSPEEFEKLALEQMDTLYRVAGRLTRDADRAGDLVQETYLRAFRSRNAFELQEHGIRPWLLRIMRNLHLSKADRDRRQPIAVDGESLDALNAAEPVPGAVPPAAGDQPRGTLASVPLDWESLDEQLKGALENLQEEYQIVLLLWAVEDLSYKEIADVLDIPIGTVMSRLHRARQKLSAQLGGFARREGIVRD